ncbi:hypothetical protein LNQ03_32540 [Klebsiella pneumoniae subsp. pneumoniae]|nr:hypothetical protein [Klebsiella pneumoniae subsp. pneumoniae]
MIQREEYRHHQGPASAGAGAEHLGAEPGDRNDRPRRRAAGLPLRCAMPAWWWKISRITRASSA